MGTQNDRRPITVKFPLDEAQAVMDEAEKMGISITLLFRLWVREVLMNDPIKLSEKV